ncbi:MAG TPA: hypothetical protein VFR67_21300 [Pilimelia sp.]|nr:hypothetical protein [Pilimelia sp.]
MRTRVHAMMAATVATGAFTVLTSLPATAAAATEQVSVNSAAVPANRNSDNPDVSASGRHVVFRSEATNLVPGDSNGFPDVFLRDRGAGQTERISVSSTGQQANQASGSAAPAITPNGRYVAFDSLASNLVASDTNGQYDVFVRDRRDRRTSRVSVGLGGAEPDGPSRVGAISANGCRVAFESTATNLVSGDTNQTGDVFVRDRRTGVTTLVSVGLSGAPANGGSGAPALSADGNLVAFESSASNLVAGDDNPYPDIFVRDLTTRTTERVSVTTSGERIFAAHHTPSISADGRYVVFANRLPVGAPGGPYTQVWIRDRVAKTSTRVVVDPALAPGPHASTAGSVSPDGRHVVFVSMQQSLGNDPNLPKGVFALDVATGAVARLSVKPDGSPATISLPYIAAADGGAVFGAASPDLVPRPGPGVQIYFRPWQ